MTQQVDKKAVGQRIKRIRLEMGYTQTEFSKAINATLPAVSNWETGKNLPNKKRLSDIAFHGQISVDELLHGVQELTIDPMILFNQQNDIRQYMSIDVSDEKLDELSQELELEKETISYIYDKTRIYVNMTDLPEEIPIKTLGVTKINGRSI